MSIESLKDMFFEECEELIESLAENLEIVSDGEHDVETINAVFRAVHSIKGSAGAFGLDELVSFAHHFETVLDLIRSDRLEIDEDVLHTVMRSSDILAELVERARDDISDLPAAAPGLIEELIELSGGSPPSSKAEPSPAEEPVAFEPIAFEPVGAVLTSEATFDINFAPEKSLYSSGHDPLKMIVALSKLGSLETSCSVAEIPDLPEFDFDEGYLSWGFVLRTSSDESAVLDVFRFAEGLCELDITKRSDTTDAPRDSTEALAGTKIEEPVTQPPPASNTQQQQAEKNVSPQTDKLAANTKAKPAAPVKQSTLRVDPERVDRLINSVGELIINHAVIDRLLRQTDAENTTELAAALDDYGMLAREIQEAVMAIRAQPVKSLFQRMARVVREAGDMTNKKVDFETRGEATEIDKTMLERLVDPLTHMLRNAVDHGIETPDNRTAAGKDVTGLVSLSAMHRSGHVVIEIMDDGAGLDPEKLLQKGIEKGIVNPDAKLSESEIYNLLFAPGFSTAANVTNLSGRGVGMDVVKTEITALGGKVTITSEKGQGSVFTISLPLTLAVMDGMIVEVGGQTVVLPLSSVLETIRPEAKDIREVGPKEWVVYFRGTFYPIVCLNEFMGSKTPRQKLNGGAFLLIESNGSTVAVSVDAIQDQRQVVIKSLKNNYGDVPGIAAATILGDGKIALIADPEAFGSFTSQSHPFPSNSDMEVRI